MPSPGGGTRLRRRSGYGAAKARARDGSQDGRRYNIRAARDDLDKY